MNRSKWLVRSIVAMGLIASGCSHVASKGTGNRPVSDMDPPPPKSLSEVLDPDGSDSAEDRLSKDPSKSIVISNGEIWVQGIRLKNTHFDYPISVNSRVEYWVDYFCGRGRKYFEKYLERSEFFIPYIAPLLKQNGLPEDLVYLAMIESGFNNLARSHAKAVGPWQFIAATGRRYGLQVNWWVDERRAIDKSTLAAVGYLRDLYGMFQRWELAAAAYNAGEAKIARAVRRFGTKDFWLISKHRFLKPETRDYVPKIIAAAIIAKNRGQFGFPEKAAKPGVGEAVSDDGEIVKLEKTDKPQPDSVYKAEKEDDLERDPVIGVLTETETAPEAQQPLPLAKPVPTPHVTKKGEVGGEQLEEFEVQSPADLLKIARAAGLSYQTVKSLNPEILRWCTPPSVSTFRIKLPAFARDRFLLTYNHQTYPRRVQFLTYKVRRGETLARIAKHFGIKVDPIQELNRVSARTPLKNGAQVLLPIPSDRTRTFASLELRDPPEKRRSRRVRRAKAKVYKINHSKQRASAGSAPGEAFHPEG